MARATAAFFLSSFDSGAFDTCSTSESAGFISVSTELAELSLCVCSVAAFFALARAMAAATAAFFLSSLDSFVSG